MSKDSIFKNNHWKWLILALIAAISVYVTNPPKEKVRLGLDLAAVATYRHVLARAGKRLAYLLTDGARGARYDDHSYLLLV